MDNDYIKAGINALKVSAVAIATNVMSNVAKEAGKGGLQAVKNMKLSEIIKL